jgi:GNAT superfamily N-acetyltransferase
MDERRLSIQVCKTQDDFIASADAEMVILDGLGQNILKNIGKVELGRPIKIFVRNEMDQVVGGLIALAFGGWVYISLLWMEESLRNLGYGTRLVRLCEEEAVHLGCEYAHVDTYSFEARPFYERLGYELFAALDDYPKGYCKYFLKKQLTNEQCPSKSELQVSRIRILGQTTGDS